MLDGVWSRFATLVGGPHSPCAVQRHWQRSARLARSRLIAVVHSRLRSAGFHLTWSISHQPPPLGSLAHGFAGGRCHDVDIYICLDWSMAAPGHSIDHRPSCDSRALVERMYMGVRERSFHHGGVTVEKSKRGIVVRSFCGYDFDVIATFRFMQARNGGEKDNIESYAGSSPDLSAVPLECHWVPDGLGDWIVFRTMYNALRTRLLGRSFPDQPIGCKAMIRWMKYVRDVRGWRIPSFALQWTLLDEYAASRVPVHKSWYQQVAHLVHALNRICRNGYKHPYTGKLYDIPRPADLCMSAVTAVLHGLEVEQSHKTSQKKHQPPSPQEIYSSE